MANKILFKKSMVLNDDGTTKTPTNSIIDYGEIAINYNGSHEAISMKNSSNEIISFVSDKDIDTLNENPTEDTLISLNGFPYKIGDKIRVNDDAIRIYKLMDITSENKAIWELIYRGNMQPYYFMINQDGVTDPYSMISSAVTDNSRDSIEWIRNNSHRYLGKYVSNDDTMYLCQLNDNDSTKFNDNGSDAILTGEQGDVFMKLPKFYYKAENTSGINWKIGFSKDEVDSTWKCWHGNDLIGAFEALYTSSKLRSIKSASQSTGSISWENFRRYARNRYGSNHGKILTWEQHCIMAFLFYAYYCHTNCEAQCGSGSDDYDTKPCGQQLSMIDTTSSNGNTNAGVNFWGLENWWGNKAELMDNVSGASNVFIVTTYDGISGAWGANRNATAYHVGYDFAHMSVGEYLDASALDSTTASDTTGYCDYFHNNGSSYLVYCSGSNSFGGVAYAAAGIFHSDTSEAIGSRLSYVGPWQEVSSDEFKSIASFA